MDHVTALPCLLLGLDGFRLLAATEHGHELVLLIETTADRDFCRICGVRAGSKGRARTTVRDAPIAGRPTVLVWKKRIWRCEQFACEAGSWRETSTAIQYGRCSPSGHVHGRSARSAVMRSRSPSRA